MRLPLQPIVAATLFGLIYGLSAPLIALRLAEHGYSTLLIGINAALHAAGVLLIAPALPWLCRRIVAPRLLQLALAFSHPWWSRAMLFCWGGIFVGIYTLMMTLVGKRFQGAALTRVYTLLSLAWGAGALIGPLPGGAAMSITQHGLAWMAALLCTLFLCLALWLNKHSC